tara:strand:+ start:15187 stop:15636 length:450 start_codon:yes stop_codon:yes gene_type:complete
MYKLKYFISIFIFSSILFSQDIDSTLIKKYYSNKKDPIKAPILSFFFPGSGHFYSGNWQNAILFGTVESVVGYVAINEYFSDLFDDTIKKDYTLFYIASVVGIGLKVFELIDVNHEVRKYNEELAESIFGRPIKIKNNYLLVIDGEVVF